MRVMLASKYLEAISVQILVPLHSIFRYNQLRHPNPSFPTYRALCELAG